MELNYAEILPVCGGRLSQDDARALHETATSIQAKKLVEIGAAGGCSSMVLANVAKQTGGHLYSIDPRPEGRWAPNIEGQGLKQYVTLVRDMSPWPSSPFLAAVQSGIDYLLIDGDHTTKCVITDYQFWQRYVRKGGYIAFHDWTGAGGNDVQVRRAVEIILETDPLEEVMRVENNRMGIIIFRKTWEGAQ